MSLSLPSTISILPPSATTMMHHHIYSADKQRRMARALKRARLNRASSVAPLIAVPTAQAPPHRDDEGMGVSDTVVSTPVSDLTASPVSYTHLTLPTNREV